MWRRGPIIGTAALVLATGAWWWVGRYRTADSPHPVRTPTPRSTVAIEADPEPPRFCREGDPRQIDFNGDGETDWVYLDWVRRGGGHAEFGWCVGNRHGAVATGGMAETLWIYDFQGDGRHEALFGGNTCCENFVHIGLYTGSRVEVVTRRDREELVLRSGFGPTGRSEGWRVFGCDPGKGGDVTQVFARLSGDEIAIRKFHYRIRGAKATLVDRERYAIPDPGERPRHDPSRAALVSETVGGCIEIFEED